MEHGKHRFLVFFPLNIFFVLRNPAHWWDFLRHFSIQKAAISGSFEVHWRYHGYQWMGTHGYQFKIYIYIYILCCQTKISFESKKCLFFHCEDVIVDLDFPKGLIKGEWLRNEKQMQAHRQESAWLTEMFSWPAMVRVSIKKTGMLVQARNCFPTSFFPDSF